MVSIPSELLPIIWREVSENDRRTMLEAVVEELQMDMGQRMPAADADYLCRKISQTMRQKYSNWRVVDFNRAIELGKIGHFGAERKLNVANVEKWLFLTNPAVMSEVIAEQLRKAQHDKAVTATMFEGAKDPVYPNAILWRINLRTLSPLPYGMSREEYLRRLSEIPYTDIVEALRTNTEKQLFDKTFTL